MTWHTRGKYGAVRQTYEGRSYHSKKEANVAAELDLRVKAKDIKGWTPQVNVPLVVNGKKVCTLIIDFKIEHNNGEIEFLECKGFWTEGAVIKTKLFLALNPGVRYSIVGNNGPIHAWLKKAS